MIISWIKTCPWMTEWSAQCPGVWPSLFEGQSEPTTISTGSMAAWNQGIFFFSFSSLFKSHSVRCVYKKMGHAIKIYLNCQEMLKHVMCFIMCKHEEMAALEKWKCWRCTPDGGPDLWAWFLHFREWAPVFGTSKIETENQQMKFLKG